MSTKIYQGFRIETDSFFEITKMAEAFQLEAERLSEDHIDTFIQKIKSHLSEFNDDEAYGVWIDLRKGAKEKDLALPPAVDTNFSLTHGTVKPRPIRPVA